MVCWLTPERTPIYVLLFTGYPLPLRFVMQEGCSTQRRRETTLPLQVTAIMLGVQDLARFKQFYGKAWAARSTRTIPSSCRSTW